MPSRLLREAVAMRREMHDGPHPQLAEALNNLGFVIDETGQNSEAEQLFREALEMKRVLLGTDHPEIAIGLNNVAFALYEQRKYDEAEVFYESALEMQRRLLGDGPSGRRDDAQQPGVRRPRQGRPEDRTRAVEARPSRPTRCALGAEHPSVARGMNNLAMWMMEANDLAAAESLLREALERAHQASRAGARRRRRHDDAARGRADRDEALRRSAQALRRRARPCT